MLFSNKINCVCSIGGRRYFRALAFILSPSPFRPCQGLSKAEHRPGRKCGTNIFRRGNVSHIPWPMTNAGSSCEAMSASSFCSSTMCAECLSACGGHDRCVANRIIQLFYRLMPDTLVECQTFHIYHFGFTSFKLTALENCTSQINFSTVRKRTHSHSASAHSIVLD